MQQQPSYKQGALPRGGRLLAAAGLASTAALLFLCVLHGPNDAAETRNLRNERQLGFGQAAGGPIDRVSKVLSHALKPRLGPNKGKDLGGPWVHKALGSDDPIERPALLGTDSMAGEEPQPEPTEVEPLAPATATDPTPKRADSVLHLGGAPRQPTTALRQAPPQHRNLQAPAPATFEMVVPVDKVNGGDDKDGDKGMLKKHGTGHKKHGHAHPHKAATPHKHAHGHGHKKNAQGHKHGHGHGALKHPVKHMAAQAHKTKKAAVHAMEKAALKGKVHKAQVEKHIEKQAAQARAKAKKAAVHAVKTAHHIKHGHGIKAKPQGHGHDVHGHKKTGHLHGHKKALHKKAKQAANHVHKTTKKAANQVHKKANHVHKTAKAAAAVAHAHAHGHKKDGHLHLRALQQQAAQAAVAERLNLSPDDVAALRAIARDAALDVIKEAVRDAGYDLDFEFPAGDDASKDEGAVDGMDDGFDGGLFFSGLGDEEADMALFQPLDLGLEDVLDALGPASFGDRQQVVNATEPPAAATATTTNTTTAAPANATQAAKEDVADEGGAGLLLSALRQMNMTANEADRLRTRARSAAESAIRDAATEAGFSGTNLDTLISSFAAARADAPPPASRRQLWGHNGIANHDAWLADRAHHDLRGAGASGGGSRGYYGAADDEEVADAWGFYDYADEAVPRSGYSDYRDGTVGSRGRASYYGNRRLHWHHHNDDAAEAEDVGPWDAWADRAESSGYFVDDEAVEDFFY